MGALIQQLIRNSSFLLWHDYRSSCAKDWGGPAGLNITTYGADLKYGGKNGLICPGTANSHIFLVDSAAVSGGWQTIGEDGDTYTLFALARVVNGVGASGFWYSNSTYIDLRQQNASPQVPFNFGIDNSVLSFGRCIGGIGEHTDAGVTVNDATHFVSVTVNDDVVRFFIDGSFISTATFTVITGDCSVSTYNPCNLTIGTRTINPGIPNNWLEGSLASIGVINYNLSDTEVSKLYGELMS